VVRLRLQFGDERSLMGRGPAGDIAGSMLMRGTAAHTRQELRDEMDRLKASGSIGGSATRGGGQIATVRGSVAEVIALMGEIARSPSFPESEFEVLKNQRLAALEEARTDPGTLAQIALQRHMDPWPVGHPRHTGTIEEELADLTNVTLAQAKAFYDDFYGPQAGNVVVVGDFDPAEVRAAIENAFGDWGSPHPYERIASRFNDVPADEIQVETPDKANAFFFAQQNLELTDGDPDYPALIMAGEMLGGGVLNSRLAKRIRVEEGLSYGVGGMISANPVDPVGQFMAYAIYAPENADRLEAAFKEEIQRALAEGFTDEEVAAAKQGVLEQRQLQRAQDPSLAGQISSNLYFDRTFEFDAALEQNIRNLTTEEINAAMRRHLDLSKITIVKAGDFAKAKPPIGSP